MNLKDLIEEIGYVPKRQSSVHGGEYSSACPFCKDGDNRFIFWPNRQNNNGTYTGGRFVCRKCDKKGDVIAFISTLRNLTYKEACLQLSITPKPMSLKLAESSKCSSIQAKDPSPVWVEKATAFVEWSHEKLMSNKEALEIVKARGFTGSFLAGQNKIMGWNPGINGMDFNRDRTLWGLDAELKADGTPRTLWLPVGLVIASLSSDGRVVRLKVRRTGWKQGDAFPKYAVVSGSKSCLSVYGDTRLPVAVVVESELDALLLQQIAGDLFYCVALGGSTNLPDADTDVLLRRAKSVLFLPDNDDAGAIAWTRWQARFPGIQKCLTPESKSAGDYHVAGGDIRGWLSSLGYFTHH